MSHRYFMKHGMLLHHLFILEYYIYGGSNEVLKAVEGRILKMTVRLSIVARKTATNMHAMIGRKSMEETPCKKRRTKRANAKHKTALCKRYDRPEGCPYPDCRYAHGRYVPYRTIVSRLRFYSVRNCKAKQSHLWPHNVNLFGTKWSNDKKSNIYRPV